ncbi:MAG: hypothetical protein IE909_11985, partial [Campylobacterales bacterium]|nr:hypothetical protein [Campylobacterales bacterium]
STPASCRFNADNVSTKTTQGSKELNTTIRHYYGRSNILRQKFIGNVGDANITYEIYCSGTDCNKSMLPNGSSSVISDDPRWFINAIHSDDAGSAGPVVQTNGRTAVSATTAIGNHPDKTTITYNKSKGYSYQTTMLYTPSSWLIYDAYNPNASTQAFKVEFVNPESTMTGSGETNISTIKRKDSSNYTEKIIIW